MDDSPDTDKPDVDHPDETESPNLGDCDQWDEKLDPRGTMSLGDHLEELRKRIIVIAAALVVCFVALMFFKDPVVATVIEPARAALADYAEKTGQQANNQLIYPDPVAGISAIFKILFVASLFITSPVAAWQLWAFVAAGLYPRERRLVYLLAPLSLGLFVGGILFCYLWLLPTALPYLIDFMKGVAAPQFFLKETAFFIIHFSLIMGLVFQIPLVVYFLVRAGILDIETLRKYRRHFYVIAFVVGALLTPPDPITQIGMALPIVAFYEGGILLARTVRKKALDEQTPSK